MRPLTEENLPPELKTLLALWRKRAGGRRFPAWQTLTPADLQPWADNIHVLEPLPDGDFFFHRFSPVSAARLGFDMTGRRLSEIMLSARAIQSTSTYRRCLTLGRPAAMPSAPTITMAPSIPPMTGCCCPSAAMKTRGPTCCWPR